MGRNSISGEGLGGFWGRSGSSIASGIILSRGIILLSDIILSKGISAEDLRDSYSIE